jgi:non-heme chloroperoxidase
MNNFAIIAAVLRKDVVSLLPIVLLGIAVQILDVLVLTLDVLPQIAMYMPYIWFFGTVLLIVGVFQLDAPASLVDDWLCRPVPKRALLLAKLLLLFTVVYGTRAVTRFGADLSLGYTVAESLQEALLLQMSYQLIAFPLIMIAAIVTSTVIQALGVMLGVFVLVFIVPTPFLGQPGPLEPGVVDAISSNGMLWMALVPAKLMALALTAFSFWIVYRHRHILLGRVMLVVSTAVSVLSIFIVPWSPWSTAYALQKSVAPYDAAAVQAVSDRMQLNHASACFPATSVGALTSDTVYSSARQALGVTPWSEEWLADAGTDGVSFITRVQPQGVPRDMRVKLAYVQAHYVDAASGMRVALRPAETVPLHSGDTFSHQWLLPQTEVERLARGDPSLELTYSMAVLKAVTHELHADGERHELDGIGYCGATHDLLNNRIVVDCFNAGARPPLVSAELYDIESSRVEGEVPNYAPPLVLLPSGSRVELNVERASLLAEPMVEVTGWQLAGFVDKTVTTKGILGADTATCPLPSETAPTTQFSSWKDDSPHTAFYFAVDDGVQLEVLDWGGEGTPLLLIHGLGATAHTWDDIAPELAKTHRVVALTRRGIGGSSRPDSGYDSATLALDAVRVLDALKIDKAVMVGSSMGGQELSWLGAEHPERVAGLIYLDAAFDYAWQKQQPPREDPSMLLPPRPPYTPDDLRSYETVLEWMKRTNTDPVPEGEMLALYNINNRFLAGDIAGVDMVLIDATEAGVKSPRYEAITAPVLALFAMPDGPQYFMEPWYDANDPRVQQLVADMSTLTARMKREASERFARLVPAAEVRDMPGASHGMHMSNPAEVVAEILHFVESKVETPSTP